MPKSCLKCNSEVSEEATFCHKCGSNLTAPLSEEKVEESEKIVINNIPKNIYNKKIILLSVSGLVIGFISIFGVLNYLENNKESIYLDKISGFSNTLVSAEENIKQAIKDKKLNESFLKREKEELSNLNKELSNLQIPSKYEDQSSKFTQMVRNEVSIIEKIDLLIGNFSLDESKSLLDEIKMNYENNKKILDSLNIAKTNIKDYSNYSNFQLLVIHLKGKEKELKEKEKQIEEDKKMSEKAKKQQEENKNKLSDFFNSFDSILHKYELARTDLGSILDKIRTGGYTFQDFYRAVEEARQSRSSLRNEVTSLLYIDKQTEKLKKQLSEVLTKSIDYCEVKRAGIKLEQDSGYISDSAKVKYSDADRINLEIKEEYSKFNSDYEKIKKNLMPSDNKDE